jgi:hypothetical protein
MVPKSINHFSESSLTRNPQKARSGLIRIKNLKTAIRVMEHPVVIDERCDMAFVVLRLGLQKVCEPLVVQESMIVNSASQMNEN